MIILFDLDGTLIDSTEAILESFHNSFKVYGVTSPSDEAIKHLIGYPLDVMYRQLGVAEESVWDYVKTYKEYYRVISTQKTYLLPYAKEAVEVAASFAKLGIVTTKTGRYSRVLMEHFELMEYFDVLIGREDVTKPKPDKEPIVKALDAFVIEEDEEIWMIGDTELDLLSANDARVKSAAVLSGYGTREQLTDHTEYIFENALSVTEYLKSRK